MKRRNLGYQPAKQNAEYLSDRNSGPERNLTVQFPWFMTVLILLLAGMLTGCGRAEGFSDGLDTQVGVLGTAVEELVHPPTDTPLPPTVTPTNTPIPTATFTRTPSPTPTPAPFSFVVIADQRSYAGSGEFDNPKYFRGAVEAIAEQGGAAFMIAAGDMDPPGRTRWTVDQVLGEDFPVFPAVGNHEDSRSVMKYLRVYNYDPNGPAEPNLTRSGPPSCPETMYSFDYQNAHFAVINEYCNNKTDMSGDGNGKISKVVYNWLAEDLAATDKPILFVVGHEPAYPQPDAKTSRIRHVGESLDKNPDLRDAFWKLLKKEKVTAYLCGHTHNYSVVKIGGVWQIDAGHARGLGDPEVPSTFVMIHVYGDAVAYETFRDNAKGGAYKQRDSGVLAGSSSE